MMPYLEALNIRNLPQLSGRSVMPRDCFVNGQAAMSVEIANKKRVSSLLKTITLGAPLYRNLSIKTPHVVHTAVSDILRFCVNKINYG